MTARLDNPSFWHQWHNSPAALDLEGKPFYTTLEESQKAVAEAVAECEVRKALIDFRAANREALLKAGRIL